WLQRGPHHQGRDPQRPAVRAAGGQRGDHRRLRRRGGGSRGRRSRGLGDRGTRMTRRQTPRPAGVRIAGPGMAVPPTCLSNDDLAARGIDTTDEWITQRTGIKTRHVVDNGRVETSSLGAQAVTQALQNAGLEPKQLDLLILATMTPDVICPASAATIVRKVGAIPCGAIDVNIACTGFVAALNLAHNYVASGHAKNVAVVASETLSSVVDWKDRRTCVLFGDGA